MPSANSTASYVNIVLVFKSTAGFKSTMDSFLS